MIKDNKKEQWITGVMDSTRCMSKVAPGDDLFMRITSKLGQDPPVKVIPFPVKKWAAAAILLLALNIGSVVYFRSHTSPTEQANGGNPLALEIQTASTYNY